MRGDGSTEASAPLRGRRPCPHVNRYFEKRFVTENWAFAKLFQGLGFPKTLCWHSDRENWVFVLQHQCCLNRFIFCNGGAKILLILRCYPVFSHANMYKDSDCSSVFEEQRQECCVHKVTRHWVKKIVALARCWQHFTKYFVFSWGKKWGCVFLFSLSFQKQKQNLTM